MPEKEEEGVFFRADRGALMISLPANTFFLLKKLALVNINKEAGGV